MNEVRKWLTLTYKCLKHGTEYVQSDSGLSISYDQNGSIVKCSN